MADVGEKRYRLHPLRHVLLFGPIGSDTMPSGLLRFAKVTERSESKKRCGEPETSITPHRMLLRCLPRISLSNTFMIMLTCILVDASGSRTARYSSNVGAS